MIANSDVGADGEWNGIAPNVNLINLFVGRPLKPEHDIIFRYAYDPGQNYLSATRSDIVDRAYRQAVTKAMNALRRQGVLDYRRELICVNHTALESA